MPEIKKDLVSPIEALFKMVRSDDKNPSKDLLSSTFDNVDLKTDIKFPEDVLISILKFNDSFLDSCGLDSLYSDYLNNLLRVRFSLDRKSRSEFVAVNTSKLSNIQIPSEFKSIEDSRK